MKRPESIQQLIFRSMLLLIVAAAVARLTLWLLYQTYEASRGHIVLHEQINEFLLFIAIDLLSIPVIVWLLLRITESVTLPIRSISSTSKKISRGDLNARVDCDALPVGDLGQVGDALNQAFDRFQEVNQRMAAFTADASHQLRTPLTSIRSTAENALADGPETDPCAEALSSVLHDAQQLSKMVEQLLMIARMDRGELGLRQTPVELGGLIRSVREVFQPLAESREIVLELNMEQAAWIDGHEQLLYEVFANLFDNALKACSSGDRVVVKHYATGDCVQIDMYDSGPGIPDSEDRAHVFDRFHRSANANYEGTGLGLAICKEIALVHGGTIRTMISPLGGAGFSLSLPQVAPAQPVINSR